MNEKDRELPAEISPDDNIQNILEGVCNKKVKSLLPKSMESSHFITSAVIAISKNPKLQECTRDSLLYACLDAAELGLDFSPTKGWAYLVPYKRNKGRQNEYMEAVLIPGYKGFIEIATRYQIVERMDSVLAYSNDEFTIQRGTDPKIVHNQCIGSDRGEVIGCYAIGWFPDNNFQFDYMTVAELNEIEKGLSYPSNFWRDNKGEMQRKTVIRRLFKYLPKTEKLEALIAHDNKILEMMEDDKPKSIAEVEDDILNDLDGPTEDADTEPVDTPPKNDIPDPPVKIDTSTSDLFPDK